MDYNWIWNSKEYVVLGRKFESILNIYIDIHSFFSIFINKYINE